MLPLSIHAHLEFLTSVVQAKNHSSQTLGNFSMSSSLKHYDETWKSNKSCCDELSSSIDKNLNHNPQDFKGGPFDLGTKILQNTPKIILLLSKPFSFHS